MPGTCHIVPGDRCCAFVTKACDECPALRGWAQQVESERRELRKYAATINGAMLASQESDEVVVLDDVTYASMPLTVELMSAIQRMFRVTHS